MRRVFVDPDAPQRDAIEEAATWIRDGGLVAIPTDTLYGLAADPFNAAAVARGRDAGRPVLARPADADPARAGEARRGGDRRDGNGGRPRPVVRCDACSLPRGWPSHHRDERERERAAGNGGP
jgi:threonylcarbamoyl-AMP synthase-like protein